MKVLYSSSVNGLVVQKGEIMTLMPFAPGGGGDMSPEEEKAVLKTIIKQKCFDPGKKE